MFQKGAQGRIQALVVSRVKSEAFDEVSQVLRLNTLSLLGLACSDLNGIFDNLEELGVISVEVVGGEFENLEQLPKVIKVVGLMQVVTKHFANQVVFEEEAKLAEQLQKP